MSDYSQYIRLMGLQESSAPAEELQEGQAVYPPTFNIQTELIYFEVNALSFCAGINSFSNPSKHAPSYDVPWSIILTFVTTRDSLDVQRFRTDQGMPSRTAPPTTPLNPGTTGPETIHCLIVTAAFPEEDKDKVLVAFGACLPPNKIRELRLESYSISGAILGLITHQRPGTARDVYTGMLEEQAEEPGFFVFTFESPSGRPIPAEVPRASLSLKDGVPIDQHMMNVSCLAILSAYQTANKARAPLPQTTNAFIWPTLEATHAEAFELVSQQPPPPDQRGWTMIPLQNEKAWSLLAVEHLGEGVDL